MSAFCLQGAGRRSTRGATGHPDPVAGVAPATPTPGDRGLADETPATPASGRDVLDRDGMTFVRSNIDVFGMKFCR